MFCFHSFFCFFTFVSCFFYLVCLFVSSCFLSPVLAKAEARRVRTLTLSDIEMRRDFRAIIVDWRERATKYLSTYSELDLPYIVY